MANIKWSADLPPCPQTWSEGYVDNLIRSKNDLGIQKVRKRFTGNVRTFQFGYTLPRGYYMPWKEFYERTLGHGLAAFEYIHPYTGEVLLVRMTATPKVTLSYRAFRVSLNVMETIA